MKKIIILLVGLGYSLCAHTLWIDDAFYIHQGHMHQNMLGENKSKVADNHIEKIKCMKGEKITASSIANLSSKKCDAVFVYLHPAYYTKTPYGTKNLPKDKSKMPLKSWQSIESVKRLYAEAKKPFGKGLEIGLRNELSQIKVGDKARLRIYYDGKPLKGAVVANGHKTIGISNEEGEINIKVRETGLQNIKASYTLKGDGKKCDEIIHTSTLNFEVKK